MKNKIQKIETKIQLLEEQKSEHLKNNRPVSAEMVQKSIDSLNFKKNELLEN